MNAHYRYIAVSMLILPCCLLFGLVIAENEFIWRHTANVEDAVLDRRFSVAGIDADVLLVGDSSLLFGVMPERIESQIGMSAYNLAVSVWGFVVSSDIIIDDYLAKNRSPRLVVLYLAPWVRVNPPYSLKMEWNISARMILGHGSFAALVHFFVQHPTAYLPFVQDVWTRLIFGFHWDDDNIEKGVSALKKGRGWLSSDNPVVARWATMKDDCEKARFPIMPDTAYIDEFRRRMAARGIMAAFYVAPTPDCAAGGVDVEAAYKGIADNQPYQLPHRYFFDDGFYSHLFRAGAEENTDKVSKMILHYIGKKSAGRDRNEALAFVQGRM
jgi:hypothetical protein